MQETDVQNIAARLVAARRSRLLVDTVDTEDPGIGAAPGTLEDAYQIQRAVADQTGAIGGWKTGADSVSAVPIAAPVFADDIYASGATLKPGSMRLIGLEVEVAFRIGRDLPTRSNPYSQQEFLDAVETMVPLIELVDSRLRDFEKAGPLWKLSDNQINGGLVIGDPIENWSQLDLKSLRAILTADQTVIKDSHGWHYPDTPAGLATRFVNTFSGSSGFVSNRAKWWHHRQHSFATRLPPARPVIARRSASVRRRSPRFVLHGRH